MKTYVTSRWKALRDKIVGTKSCQHSSAEFFESAECQEMQAKARAYLNKSYQEFKEDVLRNPSVEMQYMRPELTEEILRRAFCAAVIGPHERGSK